MYMGTISLNYWTRTILCTAELKCRKTTKKAEEEDPPETIVFKLWGCCERNLGPHTNW